MADPKSPNTHTESAISNVDTTSPFRQGFPNPLRPLPLAHFIVEEEDAENMEWWGQTKDAVVGFLEARGVLWGSVCLINRRDRRQKASKDDLTVFISAGHDPSSNSWYLMLQDVHAHLQDRGLTQLRVEIMDARYARLPDHFVVEPSHPLVQAWPGIRNEIIEALGSAPWLSFTAIRRGVDKIPEKNPVTILITTPDPLRLRPTIKPIISICENAGFDLQVEVLEESGVFDMDNPSERLLDTGSFTNPIPMGSSVSSKSTQDRSGTIGGTILVTKGDLCVRAALTNFHVLRGEVPQDIDQGLYPEQSSDVNIQAVVPSNQDHKQSLNAFQGMENIDRALATAREKWECSNNERDAENIKHFEDCKQAHCQELDAIQTFNRDAGHLWAASGFRVHPQNHCVLDWALIQLPEHRPTINLHPTYDEFIDVNQICFPGAKVEEWPETMQRGELVFKRGRTTGLTIGRFNHIDPTVNLDGKICSAWHVVSQPKNLKDFCQPGDAGSFVIDRYGRWCGLLFASPYTHRGDGFVIPIDTLIEDIEHITGGIVSLP